jgi:hypothetical protein
MQHKYVPQPKKLGPNNSQGRYVTPNNWITGPDPLRREKYYAYLKHRAQAKFRNEHYELTWDDWETLWPDELFLRRGRRNKDLCIARLDRLDSWNTHNCTVCTMLEQKARRKEERG